MFANQGEDGHEGTNSQAHTVDPSQEEVIEETEVVEEIYIDEDGHENAQYVLVST